MTTINSNNPNNDSDDLEKIDADITKHRKYALGLIISVFSIFILYFCIKNALIISHDLDGNWVFPKLSNLMTVESGDWGTFGDFIGGILNPIFALFAFYWLTYSVRLQIKELKDTRTELKKAADAQVKATEHQENIAELERENVSTQKELLKLQRDNLKMQIDSSKQQQDQISIQNFENLFFELLKIKTDATNEISESYYKEDGTTDSTIQGKIAIKIHINRYKLKFKKENWSDYYQNNLLDLYGSYFRICYQIIKLIDNNKTLIMLKKEESKLYSIKQKEYFDFFRATLTQHELEAFFFNCLNSYGNNKFKLLIEKYGLFKPLNYTLNLKDEDKFQLVYLAYKYDRIIFENNPEWNKYFDDLNKIDLTINPIETTKNLKYIKKTNIHMDFDNNRNYCLLSFDEISKKIAEKVTLLSEKFKNTKNISALSSELQQQHSELHVFKTVEFTYEMYMILKYGIDLEDYIRTKFAELTQLDNPPQQN